MAKNKTMSSADKSRTVDVKSNRTKGNKEAAMLRHMAKHPNDKGGLPAAHCSGAAKPKKMFGVPVGGLKQTGEKKLANGRMVPVFSWDYRNGHASLPKALQNGRVSFADAVCMVPSYLRDALAGAIKTGYFNYHVNKGTGHATC